MSLWDNKDSKPWESSVPEDLQLAVKHLRDQFDDQHFNFGHTTKTLCFAQIHQTLRESEHKEYIEALVQLKAFIPPGVRQSFNDRVQQATLPAIFKAYFDFCVEGLSAQAARIFGVLLKVGSAHEHRLETSAIDWAELQTKHMIRSHRHNLISWVRDICDTQPYDPDEDMDERIFWTKWQAPAFLIMKPARSHPYDSSRLWERFDPMRSTALLEGFADDYVIRLEMNLRNHAGQARLHSATQPKLTPETGLVKNQTDAPYVSRVRRPPSKHMTAIFRALQANTEGLAYCREVDRGQPFISQEWKDDGWPGSYAKAYTLDSKWKKRIQDQKSKMRNKYDRTDPREREQIIQGGRNNASDSSNSSWASKNAKCDTRIRSARSHGSNSPHRPLE